jgi:hypothetical protein
LHRFELNRKIDETGISGTGIIAEGYIYSNGICVMKWLTNTSSVAVYASIGDVEIIHGHQGKTEVNIIDEYVGLDEAPNWVFDPIGYFESQLDVLP